MRSAIAGFLCLCCLVNVCFAEEVADSEPWYWLPPEKSWTNKFGETFTFDELMERLLAMPLGNGCCAGCHVPYTVVTLLRVDEQIPILGPKIRTKAEEWVKQVVKVLEKTQKPDGTWPRDWGKTGQEGFNNEVKLTTPPTHHLAETVSRSNSSALMLSSSSCVMR